MRPSDVLPGTIGLGRITGPLGWAILFAQAWAGDASKYTHVFVALDDGTAVEAMPRRARIVPLADILARPGPTGFLWSVPLTPQERERIVAAARTLDGSRYSFASYPALGLARLGYRPAWLRRYIARSGRRICSVLGDHAYQLAGLHLFDDGRAPFEVTPGDMASWPVDVDPVAWRASRQGVT